MADDLEERLGADLQERGQARVVLSGRTSRTVARQQLLDAAMAVGLRVTLTRDGDDAVVATVLSDAQARSQRQRDALYRVANKLKEGAALIKEGMEMLEVADVPTVGMVDVELADLSDIVETLDDEARELFRQAMDT